MNVGELRELLSDVDDGAQVWVYTECHGCLGQATQVEKQATGMAVDVSAVRSVTIMAGDA